MNKLWKINLSDIWDLMTFSRRIIVRGEVNNQEIVWTEKKEKKITVCDSQRKTNVAEATKFSRREKIKSVWLLVCWLHRRRKEFFECFKCWRAWFINLNITNKTSDREEELKLCVRTVRRRRAEKKSRAHKSSEYYRLCVSCSALLSDIKRKKNENEKKSEEENSMNN